MNLDKLREEINEIDPKLLELIARRLEVVKKVGEYKKENNLPIRDPKREEELINRLVDQGKELGLPREIIEKVWKTFFEIAYRIEE